MDNTMGDSTTQPIRRSAFIYGKHRNEHRGDADAATENQRPIEDAETLTSTQRTSQHSSPASSDSDSDIPGASSHFQFDFRRQMKELDEKFDNGDGHMSRPLHATSLPSSPLPTEITGSSPHDPIEGTAPPCDTEHLSEDPFSGSLSSPTPSHPIASSLDNSPPVPRRARGRTTRLVTSDSEQDPSSNSSSVSPVRHSINTPHLRSPPTPPTSEFEMSTVKKIGKAKGKAPVRDVQPLQFNSEEPSGSAVSRPENKGKRRETSTRTKTKAPTKKERRQANIESTRIAASRVVEVARTDQAKYTKSSFFARVQYGMSAMRAPNTTHLTELSSDPIEKFSSPNSKESSFGKPTSLLAPPTLNPVHRPDSNANDKLLATAAESSDEEMPALGDIVQQEQERRKEEESRQSLHVKKLALLQSRSAGPSHVTGDDDDLEIVKDDMHLVVREEAAKRRADKTKQSPTKKKVLAIAIGHKGMSKASDDRSKSGLLPAFSEQHLKQYAKPAFMRSKDDKELLTKKQLDRMIMQQYEKEKLKLIEQREQEWLQRGGRVIREDGGDQAQTSLSQTLDAYAEQALKAEVEVEDAESDDESDDDYEPDIRGSMTPSNVDGDETVNMLDNDTVSDTTEQPTDENEEALPVGRKSGARRSTRMVLCSDDEDSEHARQYGTPSLLPAGGVSGTREHRDSMSSTGSQTEDENNKENNTKLMFDRSEDKENKAVVRHSPMSTRTASGLRMGSLFRLDSGVQRNLSILSPSTNPNDVVTSPNETVRPPLMELPREDDDPFFSPSAPKLLFTERLLQSAPVSPPRTPSSLKQSLGSPSSLRSERPRQLSQISFDENDVPGFKPQLLLPSFMEANKKRSPEPSLAPFNPANGLSQFFSDDDMGTPKRAGANANELALTLDVRLQPALEVSSTLIRKADMIFEKEQEYVVAAAQKEQKPKEVLYVNDHGFLTQTRPEVSSPEVYRMTPSQTSKYILAQGNVTQQTIERTPLRTLSFMDTPEPQSRKRIIRRNASLLERASEATAEPMTAGPSKLNAFDILGKAVKGPKVPKEKLKNSEFVAAEAEESDEDEMLGFGAAKKDDDGEDDDDDDQDKVLEGLMDDVVMNVETERPDLVQEKFREHEAEDDQRLEKFHQEVIEGKHRKKRSGRGVNLDDDSDENGDDDENRLIRRRMNKKRKIDGDDLEALGQNEETRAFYNTYHQDLIDDGDDEFKHLQDVPMEADEEEPEQRESVTTDEIRDRVREMARNQTEIKPLDPTNTEWIEQPMDDDHDGVKVKVVNQRSNRTRRPNHANVEFDAERPKRSTENDHEKKTLRLWAKDMGNQHKGTGRSANGAAVTGHAKVKSGGGSLRSASMTNAGNETKAGPSKLSKAQSMLSTVSDRSSRFG
ncbi:hypothetical protein V8B97DRAFT_1879878 [Scleroderma yunnanense]